MQARHRQQVAGEVARFCIVGVSSIIFNNLVIVALTELLGIHYLVSIFVAFLLATAIGFAFNRQWSFQIKDGARRSEFIRYVLVTLGGIAVSLIATWSLVQIGVPYYVTMLGIASLMAPVNFVAHRGWSFGLGLGFEPQDHAR